VRWTVAPPLKAATVGEWQTLLKNNTDFDIACLLLSQLHGYRGTRFDRPDEDVANLTNLITAARATPHQ